MTRFSVAFVLFIIHSFSFEVSSLPSSLYFSLLGPCLTSLCFFCTIFNIPSLLIPFSFYSFLVSIIIYPLFFYFSIFSLLFFLCSLASLSLFLLFVYYWLSLYSSFICYSTPNSTTAFSIRASFFTFFNSRKKLEIHLKWYPKKEYKSEIQLHPNFLFFSLSFSLFRASKLFPTSCACAILIYKASSASCCFLLFVRLLFIYFFVFDFFSLSVSILRTIMHFYLSSFASLFLFFFYFCDRYHSFNSEHGLYLKMKKITTAI